MSFKKKETTEKYFIEAIASIQKGAVNFTIIIHKMYVCCDLTHMSYNSFNDYSLSTTYPSGQTNKTLQYFRIGLTTSWAFSISFPFSA